MPTSRAWTTSPQAHLSSHASQRWRRHRLAPRRQAVHAYGGLMHASPLPLAPQSACTRPLPPGASPATLSRTWRWERALALAPLRLGSLSGCVHTKDMMCLLERECGTCAPTLESLLRPRAPPGMQAARPHAVVDLIRSAEQLRVPSAAPGSSGTAAAAADGSVLRLPLPGTCQRCGYISSQAVCKACVLLDGLNRGLPRLGVSRTRPGKPLAASVAAAANEGGAAGARPAAAGMAAAEAPAAADGECGSSHHCACVAGKQQLTATVAGAPQKGARIDCATAAKCSDRRSVLAAEQEQQQQRQHAYLASLSSITAHPSARSMQQLAD